MFLNILTALYNTPRTQSDMQIEEIIKRETYRANLQQLVMCRCVADSRKNLNNWHTMHADAFKQDMYSHCTTDFGLNNIL